MGLLRHSIATVRLGFGNMLARPRNALLIVAGLLIANFTLLVVLTIPAGLQRIAGHTGSAAIAVVLAGQGLDETDGNITPELVQRIGVLPGVAKRGDGSPAIAPQFVVTTKLQRRDGGIGTLLVRGVSPAFWDVVGKMATFNNGARPKSGVMQLASGRVAAGLYPFTHTGDALALAKDSMAQWHISGEFAAGGGMWESELWADLESLRGAYNAPSQSTSVWVRLSSPAALEKFQTAMRSDPRLRGFTVLRQDALYATRVGFLGTFVGIASVAIAILLGVMAILAGNSAVGLALRARRRELAMLRAIGFSTVPLFAALLVEVILLAAVCALVAAGIAALLLHAHEVNSSSGGLAIRFAMQVTPTIVGWILAYSASLGLLSTLIPAWRVLHAPLVRSLARE